MLGIFWCHKRNVSYLLGILVTCRAKTEGRDRTNIPRRLCLVSWFFRIIPYKSYPTDKNNKPLRKYAVFFVCLYSYRTFCSASHALIRPTSASLNSNDAEAKALSRAAAKALWISDASFFSHHVYAFEQERRRFAVIKEGKDHAPRQRKQQRSQFPASFPSLFHEEMSSFAAFSSEAERDFV